MHRHILDLNALSVFDIIKMRILLNQIRVSKFHKLKNQNDLEGNQKPEENIKHAQRRRKAVFWHLFISIADLVGAGDMMLEPDVIAQGADDDQDDQSYHIAQSDPVYGLVELAPSELVLSPIHLDFGIFAGKNDHGVNHSTVFHHRALKQKVPYIHVFMHTSAQQRNVAAEVLQICAWCFSIDFETSQLGQLILELDFLAFHNLIDLLYGQLLLQVDSTIEHRRLH